MVLKMKSLNKGILLSFGLCLGWLAACAPTPPTLSFNCNKNTTEKIQISPIQMDIFATAVINPDKSGPIDSSKTLIQPMALNFDTAGNLYVADQLGLTKITPDQKLHRLNLFKLEATGKKPLSRFFDLVSNISHLEVNSKGEIFLFEGQYSNSRIYKISTDGTLTWLLGKSRTESPEKPVIESELKSLNGFVIDEHDQLWLSDYENDQIYLLNSQGKVIPIGPHIDQHALFASPIFWSKSHHLVVSGELHEQMGLYALQADGTTYPLSGCSGYVDGPRTEAKAIIQDSFLVSDQSNNIYFIQRGYLRRISPDGEIVTLAEPGSLTYPQLFSGSTSSSEKTLLASPLVLKDLAIHPDGRLFLLDNHSHILEISLPPSPKSEPLPEAEVETLTTLPRRNPLQADDPYAPIGALSLSVTAQNQVLVADAQEHQIWALLPEEDWGAVPWAGGGTGQGGFANGPRLQARFSYPQGLTADREGNLYFVDQKGEAIRKITTEGQVTTLLSSNVIKTAEGIRVSGPINAQAVAIDQAMNIYLSSMKQSFSDGSQELQILKLTPEGRSTNLQALDKTDSALSMFSELKRYPLGMVKNLRFDSNGNLIFADKLNHRIWRMDPEGHFEILAGNGMSMPQSRGSLVDGPRAWNHLSQPTDLGLDAQNNLIILDTGNHVVRRLDAQGHLVTLAGTGIPGYQDGPAKYARFDAPQSIALDTEGNIYIAEPKSRRIRRIRFINK